MGGETGQAVGEDTPTTSNVSGNWEALAGYLCDAWDAGLSMRKHVAVLIVVVVVLAGLVAGFSHSTARDREVRSHLRSLEYSATRGVARNSGWRDWLVPTTWSERRRIGSNPQQQVEYDYDAFWCHLVSSCSIHLFFRRP